jgi:hypothetical protein
MFKFMLRCGLCLLGLSWLHVQAKPNDQESESLAAALNRVPVGAWDRIAFTDYNATMQTLGEAWPPENAALTERQRAGWEAVWQPEIFSGTVEIEKLGFSPFNVGQVILAQSAADPDSSSPGDFMLWLEGAFESEQVVQALQGELYQPVSDFPVEAYFATRDNPWSQFLPFIALPDGHTLLGASSREILSSVLQIYDGAGTSLLRENPLLAELTTLSPRSTSGYLRLNEPADTCPIAGSLFTEHGLQYDPGAASWQYTLNLGYTRQQGITNIRGLADSLEFSVMNVPPYPGVLGQHTHILSQGLYEHSSGRILQFVMGLHTTQDLAHLPFDVAPTTNPCALFESPPAASAGLALAFLPDLSGNQANVQIRFGNTEQALYNAGWTAPSSETLTEEQQTTLNSTWRTALAFEQDFPEWFGFSAQNIEQVAEISLQNNEYIRVVWGRFTTSDVEAALGKTGYVPIEQYGGTRVFTLRNTPEVGGVLLSSLTQNAASPGDGVLIFASQPANIRLVLDIFTQNFRSSLLRVRDLLLTARALEDSTNVTLRRFVNPVDDGLVCGVTPYRVEGFANVLREDGWHFLYALGSNQSIEDPDSAVEALAAVLENSDYPVQGPGSETFGALSTVIETRTVVEPSTTVLLVDLRIDAPAQQASFFGQDLAQASLPPCVLGDLAG